MVLMRSLRQVLGCFARVLYVWGDGRKRAIGLRQVPSPDPSVSYEDLQSCVAHPKKTRLHQVDGGKLFGPIICYREMRLPRVSHVHLS
jgi:hypothetical protein